MEPSSISTSNVPSIKPKVNLTKETALGNSNSIINVQPTAIATS